MTDFSLIEYMEGRIKRTPLYFERYMYPLINWNAQMIGLTGPRGIGKSTMMLQYLIKNRDKKKSLYVSADNIWFSTHTLLELADDFVKEGGNWLCIDEVHRYEGWSREVKQIYDSFPELQVVFTGSSVLDINKGQADLSRRALMYHMQGLSFREYLELYHHVKNPVYPLQEIIEGKVKINGIDHLIPVFREYLKNGYYPFAIEGDFPQRMNQIISQTVETDIPLYADMKASTARKIKHMLGIISTLAPYKPNFEHLAQEIKVSKNNVPDYLTWLEKAGMIMQLRDGTHGMRSLGKIEKIFLDNPSLMSSISGGSPNVGNVRETFFLNQMRVKYEVYSSKEADFMIDGFTFEIGGKNKGQKQIVNVDKGFIVKDDIEIAYQNIIPLYHFGFIY